MPLTIDRPGIEDDTLLNNGGSDIGDHGVKIYNNETTSMATVIFILMKATGCDAAEANLEMNEAHIRGWCIVHYASKEECTKVAGIICTVGVRAEVVEDP